MAARLIAVLGTARRYLLIPALSAVVGFGVAVVLLNPQWVAGATARQKAVQFQPVDSLTGQAGTLWSSLKEGVLTGVRMPDWSKGFAVVASSLDIPAVFNQILPDHGLHWPDWLSVQALLSQLPRPGQEGFAPRAQVTEEGRVQTQFSSCPQFFPAGYTPLVPGAPGLRELCFSAFAILHGGQTRTPVFVVQRLNRASLIKAREVSRTDRFYADARLPLAERAELSDYAGSGYSRGHMAPAADMPTPEAMAQSFALANMVPQNQRHNAGAWSRIEDDTRKYVMRARGDVFVFTGPYYGHRNEPAAAGRVAVPSHLFKVVYDATEKRAWVHWHWNSDETLAGPPIAYAEFVRRTGLQLLPTD